jgi:outer membrane protein
MKTRAIMVIAAALCAAGAYADPRVLGLQECIGLGTASSPELRTAALETGAADARVDEAWRQFLPSVSVQGAYARLSDVTQGSITSEIELPAPIGTREVTVDFPPSLHDNTSLRVMVQQPVFTGFRISSSIRQAEELRESSRQDLVKNGLDLRCSIRKAYWNFAKAKALEQSAREAVAQREAHLADADKLLDEGAATRNDALQARIGLEDARIEFASAVSFRAAAKASLALIVGLAWNADIDVAEVPAAADAGLPSLEEQISRALSSRPEVRSAHSRAAAQEEAVRSALSGLYPGVYVTGDCTLADPNSRVFPQADRFTGTWSIGVFATLDIGRYPIVLAQADQARARLAQARETERGLADAVTLEVVRARLSVEEAASRCAALRKESLELEENDQVVQERYRQGVVIATESLDARTAAVRARLREQAAACDLAIAQAALERALGE